MKKQYIYNYKFNSVFIKTFIVLILFSIIPIIGTNAIIYKRSISTIEKQAFDINMNMLVKTSESVNLAFKQVDQIIEQVAKDSDIVNMIIDPSKDSLANDRKVITNLQNISFASNYVSSIYVYSVGNHKVLSSSGGLYKIDSFYDNDWLKDYEKTFLGTKRLDTRKILSPTGVQNNCITFIRNIPYTSWSKLGAVVVNVSEDKLYQTIAGTDSTAKGEFYVINQDGYVVSSKDKGRLQTDLSGYSYIGRMMNSIDGYFIQEVNGKQMLFTYVTSNSNGWKYIYSIPLNELKSDSDIVSRIIIIATLLCLLFSLIFAYLISKGMYSPVEDLMNLVSASPATDSSKERLNVKDEYEFLGYAYNNVIDKNKYMQKTLDNIKPMVKEKLFTNLLNGKAINLEEVFEKLGFLGIDFSSSNFIVVAMQIDDYNNFYNKFNEVQRSLYKVELENLVQSIISRQYKSICVEAESDKIASVINMDNNISLIQSMDELLGIVEIIKDEVKKAFPFTITLGIGRMYKDIANINMSYKEAVNALKFKLYQGKDEIINIDDIEVKSEELYYHDSEKEKMIINNLKVGERTKVEELISELVEEILDNRNLPYSYIQQVFIKLVNRIVELIINMGMTVDEVFGQGYDIYGELSNKETMKDIKEWLIVMCGTVVDAINSENNSKSKKNAEKILEYINGNLNKDISLNEIADWIGFSRAYVCKVFKDYTGKSYIDYLNGCRIEKAKQLLKDTKLSIKEVGFRIGFNNIQTFMRTFKKYEGITPGQYRDKVNI